MKKYGELNLRKLREEQGLDFAHFTFPVGMCSCCYGPQDMAKSYWHDGKVRDDNEFTYILFKNAYNGSGHVTKQNVIRDKTCIMWRFPMEKMDDICDALMAQLDDDYIIEKPESDSWCIKIRTKVGIEAEEAEKRQLAEEACEDE